MPDVIDLKAKVSADVSPFNSAMESTSQTTASSLKMIGQYASMYLRDKVARAFMDATNRAYDFGQTIADISSISVESIDRIRKGIKGLDNVYGDLKNVGESIYEVISSGFDKSADELLHFQKVISQTSVSIRADMQNTSNVLTTLANAYGVSVRDVQKLSDMLFVTVREGKAQGNELARTLGLVTNTAAEAGVSLSEMSAVISLLSRTQSASQTMIGFNQLLNGLINPTIEAREEAAKWNLEIGATALKTKGLTAILTEMHDKIGGNVEAINKILGNIRAMRAGVTLTGTQFDEFIGLVKTAEEEIGGGVAFEAFTKQTNTAKQALKNLSTQHDKTLVAIGESAEFVTSPAIQGLERFLKSVESPDSVSSLFDTEGAKVLDGFLRANTIIVVIKSIIEKIVSDIRKTLSIVDKIEKSINKTASGVKDVDSSTKSVKDGAAGVADGLSDATVNAKALHDVLEAINRTMQATEARQQRIAEYYAAMAAQPKRHIGFDTEPQEPQEVQSVKSPDFAAVKRQRQERMTEAARAAVKERYTEHTIERSDDEAAEIAHVIADKHRDKLLAKWKKSNTTLRDKNGKFVSGKAPMSPDGIPMYGGISDVNEGHLINRPHTGSFYMPDSAYYEISDKNRDVFYRAFRLAKNTGTKGFVDNVTGEFATEQEALQKELDRIMEERNARARELWEERRSKREYRKLGYNKGSDEYNRAAYAVDKRHGYDESSMSEDVRAARDKQIYEEIQSSRRRVKHENRRERNARARELWEERAQRSRNASLDSGASAVRKSFSGMAKSFTKGVRGSLNMLYKGFSAFTGVLAAIDIGLMIGNAIREAFGTDDMFISDKVRKALETDLEPTKKDNEKAFRRLKNADALSRLEEARFSVALLNAKTEEEILKLNKELYELLRNRVIKESDVEADSAKQKNSNVISEELESYKQLLEQDIETYDFNSAIKQLRDAIKKEVNNKALVDEILPPLTVGMSKETYNAQLEERIKALRSRKKETESSWLGREQDRLDAGITNGWLYARIDDAIQLKRSNLVDIDKILRSVPSMKYYDTKTNEQKAVDSKKLEGIVKAEDTFKNALKGISDIKFTPLADTFNPVTVNGLETQVTDIVDVFTKYEETYKKAVKDNEALKKAVDEFKASIHKETDEHTAKAATAEYDKKIRANDVAIKDMESSIRDFLNNEGFKKYVNDVEESLVKSGKDAKDIVGEYRKIINSLANARIASDDNPQLKNAYNTAIKTTDEALRAFIEDALSKKKRRVDDDVTAGRMTETHAAKVMQDYEKELKKVLPQVNTTYKYAIEYDRVKKEQERKHLQDKIDAGIASESDLRAYDVSTAKEEYKKALAKKKSFSAYAAGTPELARAEQDLVNASLKLQKAFMAVENAAMESRNAIMSQVQTLMGKRNDKTYKVSNDSLYHSINMMSLAGNTVPRGKRSSVAGVSSIGIPNMRNAQQAQTQVSRSLDAWIMEQKYSQANVGKTVGDIYTYMKNNNTIFVGGK